MTGSQVAVSMTGSEWFEARPGGLNRYFQDLFLALASREDVFLSASAFGPVPHVAQSRSASWGDPAGGTLGRVRRSRRGRVSARPDILDRHFALYGPSKRRIGAAREVVHFQGPWAQESRVAGESFPLVGMKRMVEKARYHGADHFIVLSQAFETVLVQSFDIAPGKISIIPPGVDLAKFEPAPAQTNARPMVLCVRRLERRMGIHVLIKAWNDVVEMVPDAILQIVGVGTYEAELRDLASRSARKASILFRGRLSDADLRAAYAASTITVVPTIELEGFGLIALESLAMARPAIVTDCGGLPDAVRGLDESLIVPSGDAPALAKRLGEALLADRPSEQRCRSHAESFAWPLVADKHLQLYSRLLNES